VGKAGLIIWWRSWPALLGLCSSVILVSVFGACSSTAPSVDDTETVTLQAARDATLFQVAGGDTASGSGTGLYTGINARGTIRRALLFFHVDTEVSEGATIESVVLKLHLNSAPKQDTVSISLHKVLANWGEGASVSKGGQGVPAETGDATWLHRFYPDSLWSETGGEFDLLAVSTADSGLDTLVVWTSEGLRALVQDWLDRPEDNFGLLLMGDETGRSTVRRYDSREQETEVFRPRLVVTFVPE
jgi:hypothetical protein